MYKLIKHLAFLLTRIEFENQINWTILLALNFE